MIRHEGDFVTPSSRSAALRSTAVATTLALAVGFSAWGA